MALTPASAKRRFVLRSAVLLVSASVLAVLLTVAGERSHARYDLTATRQHALSPRTKQILASASRDYEIAVVADFATVSPLARSAMDDVLSELVKSSGRVRVTQIDAGRPDQEAEFAELLDRLAALYADDISARETGLSDARAAIDRSSALMIDASTSLAETASATDATDPVRQALEGLAATLRVRARDGASAAQQIDALRERRLLASDLAPLDEALTSASAQLDSLATDAALVLARVEAAAPGTRATTALENARDTAASASETLSALAPSELYAIVRALERDDTAVVLSDAGATAVSFSALFPPADLVAGDDRGVAEFRFVGEELLATAVAALENSNRPIVVLVHPWPVRLLTPSGAPNPQAGPLAIAGLLDRLRLRGVDAFEWAVAEEDAPPTLSEFDPAGERPIVWAVLGTVASGPDGAVNNGKLATAIEELLGAGEALLLSYSPSTLPGAGSPDLLTQPLAPLGVTLDTGRPLLRAVRTPQGDSADPGFTLSASTGDHLIAQSIDGLTARFGWLSPIDLDPAPGVNASSLYEISGDDVWAESQWTDLWSSSQNARRRLATPTPTPGLDDSDGPWTIAATLERASPSEPGELQRVVVVGATAWFFDASILPARRVDGRVAAAFPGNGELFDASVSWLSGQDHLIAPGAVARDIPRVQSIQPGALTILRWALALGPALAVLLIGAAVRMIRG